MNGTVKVPSADGGLSLFSDETVEAEGHAAQATVDPVPCQAPEDDASARAGRSEPAETPEGPKPIPARPSRVRLQDLRPHPLAQGVVRQDHVDALQASLEVHGQIQPLIVANDFTVLDGHHRLQAMAALDLSHATVIVRPYPSTDPRAIGDFHATQVARRRAPAERNLLLMRSLRALAGTDATTLPRREELAQILHIDANSAGKLATIATSATQALADLFLAEPLPTAVVQTLHQLSQLPAESQTQVTRALGGDARYLGSEDVREFREQLATAGNPGEAIDRWCERMRGQLEDAASDAVAAALSAVTQCANRVRERLLPPARRAFDKRLAEAVQGGETGRVSPGTGISHAPAAAAAPRRARRPRRQGASLPPSR